MLLQRLREYSDRLDLPPTLYNEAPVRYVIELDAGGRLLNPQPTDTADPSSPRTKRGQRRLVPQVQRASGIKSLLLADKADYALGYAGENGKPERVAACHAAFLDLLGGCASQTGEPVVGAVQRFLSSGPLNRLDLGDTFDPGATVTFRVDGVFPIDLPSVRAFWAAHNDPGSTDAPVMQCLVCGQERRVLGRLQGKIKGVPGGQTSGTSIISANAEAFESYGLHASLIAPTCADCGERFTKAANALLGGESTCIKLGGAAFVFWTRVDVGFDLRAFLSDPQPEEVRGLLQSVRKGGRVPDVDSTKFYATVLSGSGGRAVVRDWLDTTVSEVKDHLASWFSRQRIVDPYGEEPQPLGLYALAAATVRDAQRELAPPTPRSLLRSALTGAPVPPGLLYQAVRRNRAVQGVTRPRAALIKLVLLSHQTTDKEDSMVQLDQDNPSAAYRCGRLLAVLEQIQRQAIPSAGQTIVDRFFGTASSAPASVFGRLLRGAQPHLAKLERDKRGAYIALQRRLEDIQAGIPASGFPRVLTLEDQGVFALGYYHQRAFDRAQAREAAERRKAGAAPAEDESPVDEDLPAND
ncbi:MAG: type I-C CRISPR-associated protein Cas8c/Csd1 [Dehalococcoidia bacterium]|nr:type I-C CRISPR-associated protein Cas8c/Csd1 [Dehalococcoidia bacterium]